MSDDSTDPSQDENPVLTPGGPRSRDRVHLVHPGESVRSDETGKPKITSSQDAPVKDSEGSPHMPSPAVLTPGGYRPPSLVHRVDAGHALHMSDGRARLRNLATKALIDIPKATVQPDQLPTLGSSWIAYAFWINETGTPISSFRTTWLVPPSPSTQSNQTIFLFNGIDPINPASGILQPVLQWGPSAAGGGPSWSVASWHVAGDGQAFHTSLVPVNTGDTLVGVMTLTGQAGDRFDYTAEFLGIPGTNLQIQNIEELVWCNETLEAYSIDQCSDYPDIGLTALQAISILTGDATPTLKWTPVNQVSDCGQRAIIVSNSATAGEVDLCYRG